MKLLDPYFQQISTTSHLMTRNIKEDVIDLDGKEVFPPRTSKTIDVHLSEKSKKYIRWLTTISTDVWMKQVVQKSKTL